MKKNKDETYVIRNGEKEIITTPNSGYGKQIITWQDGKITHFEVSFTSK